MKESMEDRIIERYLNGQMRPDEEKDFRTLLEVDPELRRRMQAEKIVQKTLENDLVCMQQETGASYSRFLAALATSVPAAEAVTGQGIAGSSSAAGSGSAAAGAGAAALPGGLLSSIFASGVAKGLIGFAAVVTMATGVYIATPDSSSLEQPEPARVVAPAGDPQQTLPGSADSSSDRPAALQPQSIEPSTPRSDDAMLEQKTEVTSLTPAAEKSTTSAGEQQSQGAAPRDVTAPIEKQEDALDAMLKSMEKDASRKIDVFESDSVNAKIRIGTKK